MMSLHEGKGWLEHRARVDTVLKRPYNHNIRHSKMKSSDDLLPGPFHVMILSLTHIFVG